MIDEFYLEKAKNYLVPAMRQYKHNDDSQGFVAAFDYDETIKLVAYLIEVAGKGMQPDYDEWINW